MNASKFGSIGDEMIGLPNDISIKSRANAESKNDL